MSDSASGWIVYKTDLGSVERALLEMRLAAFVFPSRSGVIAVFPNGELRGAVLLSQKLPNASVVTLTVADDAPIALEVFQKGASVLSERVPPIGSMGVEDRLKKVASQLGLQPMRPVQGTPNRTVVYRMLGVPLFANHNYHTLSRWTVEESYRYDGFIHLRSDGTKTRIDDGEALEEPVAPPPQARRADAPAQKAVQEEELVDEMPDEEEEAADEEAELSAGEPGGEDDGIDLRKCRTARQWLDMRKQIEPATASERVLKELESVIREGRFIDEGDLSVVVREAAAMLLARSLQAQKVPKAASMVAKWKKAATSKAERQAWDIVRRMIDVPPGKKKDS